MKVAACYKVVPEEQDITVKADKTLNVDKAEWKIGQYDLNAIEAGVQLAEVTGGELVALSAGGQVVDNSKIKKAALSRGLQSLCLVADEALETADCYTTAAALAAAIGKIGGVDLVLCGEGSGDIYAQQVGVVLGEMLGWATLNAVSKITPDGDKLVVERTLENEVEALEVLLPAVISVTTDINKPRIPTLKEIMAAGKKTAVKWSLTDLQLEVSNKTECISTLAPEETDRKRIVIEGDSDENIAEFYEHLRKVL
ncbi:electron transfer flavoprotein [Desulfitobacterium chlororespirans]|uniref:electron transfer flavoprotein n=1 Tax=Desulfitobacterium chlororespirans TaxID=51616 RepID=UPI0009351CE7|nr:electron transfer flavoprotein [Desulfitobacterium chlororespirans]